MVNRRRMMQEYLDDENNIYEEDHEDLQEDLLMEAIENDFTEIVEGFVGIYPNLAYKINGDGHTPLMYACQMGHLESVKVLVPHSDVNQEGDDNSTALTVTLDSEGISKDVKRGIVQELLKYQDMRNVGAYDKERIAALKPKKLRSPSTRRKRTPMYYIPSIEKKKSKIKTRKSPKK